jgi:hypothetical protein
MEHIKPGQEFEIERLDRGDYRLVRRAAPPNEGALEWLLACPHKDFFVPITGLKWAELLARLRTTGKRCRLRMASSRPQPPSTVVEAEDRPFAQV